MSNLIQYLLGKLSQEDRLRLEDRYLADPDLFHELVELESDLYDDYARGKMSAAEEREFESQFLTTRRGRERLAFVRAFQDYVSGQRPLRSSSREFVRIDSQMRRHPLLAVALAILLVVVVVSVWRTSRFRNRWENETQSVHLQENKARGTPGSNSRARANQTTTAPSEGVFSATLTPGLFRDASHFNLIAVPPRTSIIHLQLVLGRRDRTTHSIFIQTTDGKSIWRAQDLRSDPQLGFILADVPADVLVPGDYLISITEGTVGSGAEDLHIYACRVTKQ